MTRKRLPETDVENEIQKVQKSLSKRAALKAARNQKKRKRLEVLPEKMCAEAPFEAVPPAGRVQGMQKPCAAKAESCSAGAPKTRQIRTHAAKKAAVRKSTAKVSGKEKGAQASSGPAKPAVLTRTNVRDISGTARLSGTARDSGGLTREPPRENRDPKQARTAGLKDIVRSRAAGPRRRKRLPGAVGIPARGIAGRKNPEGSFTEHSTHGVYVRFPDVPGSYEQSGLTPREVVAQRAAGPGAENEIGARITPDPVCGQAKHTDQRVHGTKCASSNILAVSEDARSEEVWPEEWADAHNAQGVSPPKEKELPKEIIERQSPCGKKAPREAGPGAELLAKRTAFAASPDTQKVPDEKYHAARASPDAKKMTEKASVSVVKGAKGQRVSKGTGARRKDAFDPAASQSGVRDPPEAPPGAEDSRKAAGFAPERGRRSDLEACAKRSEARNAPAPACGARIGQLPAAATPRQIAARGSVPARGTSAPPVLPGTLFNTIDKRGAERRDGMLVPKKQIARSAFREANLAAAGSAAANPQGAASGGAKDTLFTKASRGAGPTLFVIFAAAILLLVFGMCTAFMSASAAGAGETGGAGYMDSAVVDEMRTVIRREWNEALGREKQKALEEGAASVTVRYNPSEEGDGDSAVRQNNWNDVLAVWLVRNNRCITEEDTDAVRDIFFSMNPILRAEDLLREGGTFSAVIEVRNCRVPDAAALFGLSAGDVAKMQEWISPGSDMSSFWTALLGASVQEGSEYALQYLDIEPGSAAQIVLQEAQARNGWIYSQEQRTQKGYADCSSLVAGAFKSVGLSFGAPWPTAAEIGRWCDNTSCRVPASSAQPGDIILWGGRSNGRYLGIYHVALYAGDGMMWEASPSAGGVIYRPVRVQNPSRILFYARPLAGAGISWDAASVPEDVKGARKVRLQTTAYCEACDTIWGEGRTASGTMPKRGTIATSKTKQFPFGTKLYIPGYGYGTVEDIGGFSDGTIDLYLGHRDICTCGSDWGRKNLTVYVL